MSPESPIENYTSSWRGLSSGESIPKDSQEQILDIGLKYTMDLIKQRQDIPRLMQQNDKFLKFLSVAALLRLNRFFFEAKSKGLEKADSLEMFEELRIRVCKEMGFPKETFSENDLTSLITKASDGLIISNEKDLEIEDINRVREYVSQLIPDNPRQEIKSAHDHILD
jgi:hypothetical protein